MERLTVASAQLDQEIVPWFQSWRKFTRALELDFRPSLYDCLRAAVSIDQKRNGSGILLQIHIPSQSIRECDHQTTAGLLLEGLTRGYLS